MALKRPIIGGAGILALAASLGFVIHAHKPLETMPVFHPAAPASRAIKKSDARVGVFGHPMVPGGIHNMAELRANAGLYPSLNVNGAVFMNLAHGTFAFVSYQKNGVTYWTKKPRWIPQGEPVIFDGSMWILQKCGNMLRFTVPLPVETLDFGEPDDIYPPIEVPVAPTMPPPETTGYTPPLMGPPPPITTYATPAAILMPPIVNVVPPIDGTPPVEVPEPSTMLMLFFGLLVVIPRVLRRVI